MQAENDKVVAAMLRLSARANEIALVQRQSLIIERMSRSVDNVFEAGSLESLSNNINRDSQTFRGVLDGLINGNRELLLSAATNPGVRSSLTKIEELFRSVSAAVSEILTQSTDVVQVKTAADAIYAGSTDLLLASDELIESYESGSGQGFASPMLGLVFVGGSLLLFLLISALIYRQSIPGGR